MKKAALVIILFGLLASQALSRDLKQIFQTNRGCVVKLETDHGSGTGFFINKFGTILTCYHVVENSKKINVRYGNERYEADLLNYWKEADQAIFLTKISDTPYVKVNPGYDKMNEMLPSEMDPVLVMGFPLGMGLSVNEGKISSIYQDGDLITFQTDAAINPGNSGGPVFNNEGNVIGLATSKIDSEKVKNVSGMNYINSIDWLIHIVPFLFQANAQYMIKKYGGFSYGACEIYFDPQGTLNDADLVIYNIYVGYNEINEISDKPRALPEFSKEGIPYQHFKTIKKKYAQYFYRLARNDRVKQLIVNWSKDL